MGWLIGTLFKKRMASNNVVRTESEMEEDDDFSSDEDWHEVNDVEDNKTVIDCLFCTKAFSSIDAAVFHCSKDHGLNLGKLKGKHKMDCYSYIKMVNLIRKTSPSCHEIMTCVYPIWLDEKYLTPANREDPWLMFDFEDVEEIPVNPSSTAASTKYHTVNIEDGKAILTSKHYFELERTVNSLRQEVNEKSEALSRLLEEMKCMQETLGAVIGTDEESSTEINQVGELKMEEDKDYFNTYAHFGIHQEMLSDDVRTLAYRNALNTAAIEGKIVLDLGCGTGILSMFAAQAGAASVIAIDQSEIIYHAMDIIRENQLEKKITVVKGRIEDTELPKKQVDVIVSEWMGYFLLFEAMLDSVIYARDKHLRPGGILMPNRCSLSILGISDLAMHKEMLGFWSDVHGFKMSSLRSDVVKEPCITIVSPDSVVTSSAQLCLLNLMTVTTDCVDFTSDFLITATKDTELTALVGYFDVFFDLTNSLTFSTGPLSKPTHWKQTVFLIETPINIKKGEEVKGRLMCQRNRQDIRALIISINLANIEHQYILS